MDFSHYLELINNCDEDDPLLSDTPLGQCLSFVPLLQVAPADLALACHSLNVEQPIRTHDGLARDYRGLAELMGLGANQLEAHFKRANNPTRALIEAHVNKQNLANNSFFSVTDLLRLVEKLERFDVIDDLLPALVKLANKQTHAGRNFNKVAAAASTRQAPAQSSTSSSTSSPTTSVTTVNPNSITQITNNTSSTLTSTVPLATVQQYDAFICYAPEDYDYAISLIDLLESNNKRCITLDNIIAGQLKYNALVQMIAEECKRVILILTPNFIKSKDCDFQSKFAYEIAIQSAQFPKVIPILYEPVDEVQLPCLLRVISKIDMTPQNASRHGWQMRKVLSSLNQGPSANSMSSHHNSVSYYENNTHPSAMVQNVASLNQSPLVPALNISQHDSNFSELLPGENRWADTTLKISPEPIVDLAQSQSSRTSLDAPDNHLSHPLSTSFSSAESTELYAQLSTTTTTTTSNPSHNPIVNWYRSFKRKVRGNPEYSISPSLSSRTNLLLPSSSSNITHSHDHPSK